MKEIIIVILTAILLLNVADYVGVYDIEDTPFVAKYVNFDNYPLIGGYSSTLDGITLPRYSGPDLWGDMDGDGVMNVYDCCWEEPTNWLGVYFGTGCPDSDYDGIADRWDECPTVAGDYQSLESPLGCPKPKVIPTPTPTTPPATTTTNTTTTDTNGTAVVNTNSSWTNVAPVASFTYVFTGNTIYVDGSNSSDDVNVTSYVWNWGDGTVGTGITASHAYETSGVKYIILVVADGNGETGMTIKEVTVDVPITGSSTTKFQRIFGFLIFLAIIIGIILFSSPRARKGVIMFGKKKKILPKSSRLMKTPKAPKILPPSQEQKIPVRSYYRRPKGEGGGKGFL